MTLLQNWNDTRAHPKYSNAICIHCRSMHGLEAAISTLILIVLIVSTCCLQDCDDKFNLDLEIRARPRRPPASIPLAAKALLCSALLFSSLLFFSLLFSPLLISSQPSGGARTRMPLVFQFLPTRYFWARYLQRVCISASCRQM